MFSSSRKVRKRVKFNPSNPEHKKIVSKPVSDDENIRESTNKDSNILPDNKYPNKKSKLLNDTRPTRKMIVIVGDDRDIDPDDIDNRGNIKNLIDYSDKKDYKEYERICKLRNNKEEKMESTANIIFSETCEDEDESKDKDKEEEEEEEEDEEEEEEDEDYQNSMSILIPFLLGKNSSDPQTNLQARILASNIPTDTKELVIKRLDNTDLDKPKQLEWIESLLSIPFGKYATTPVSINDSQEKILGFFEGVVKNFDQQVYGLQSVKQEILDYIGQFITAGTSSSPRVLALWGSAGVGKTYIVRTALSEILNRPLRCINMGGVKDTVYMTGFDYTYSSSRYGIIIQTLIEKQVMNPIILFEEVDKISETKDGADIQNVLMHITDPEQNTAFQDKYFVGIDIDISKAIFVLTLNDPSLLHPILLNRLHLVKVPDPGIQDKISIGKRYMLPKIIKNIGMDPSSIVIPDEIYRYLITQYCAGDKGLRGLKKCLESIVLRLNTIKLIGIDMAGKIKVKFPLTVNKDIVDKIIINKDETSDIVHSMYA